MPKMGLDELKTGGGGVKVVVLGRSERRLLTAAEFQGLSDVPPEAEWFANIANPRTRRAYQGDIQEFMMFCGHRRGRGVPPGDPRPCTRLAQGTGAARSRGGYDPPEALGPGQPV